MVQSAYLRDRHDSPCFRQLDRPRLGRILLQGKMRSRSVIVVEIQTKGSTERGLAEDDQVIEAFTPNGSDDALDVGSLPRRPRSGQHFPDSHGFGLLHEVSTENPISIAQQIARRGIPGKCLH